MKKLKFHLRHTWNKIHALITVIVIPVALYYLIFDSSSFETYFDYYLGWFLLVFLILFPNYLLIRESIQEWKRKFT